MSRSLGLYWSHAWPRAARSATDEPSEPRAADMGPPGAVAHGWNRRVGPRSYQGTGREGKTSPLECGGRRSPGEWLKPVGRGGMLLAGEAGGGAARGPGRASGVG